MKKRSLFSIWLSMFGFSLLLVAVTITIVAGVLGVIDFLSRQTPLVQAINLFLAFALFLSVALTSIYRLTHDNN